MSVGRWVSGKWSVGRWAGGFNKTLKIIEKFRSLGRKAMATQKKMFSGLLSALHGHIGFTVSLKPSLSLRPSKWVNRSFNRDNNFNPIVS